MNKKYFDYQPPTVELITIHALSVLDQFSSTASFESLEEGEEFTFEPPIVPPTQQP